MNNDVFGLNAVPQEQVEELQERIDLVIHKLKFFPDKPKVACITQLNPITFSNERISSSINIAGGIALENLKWDDLINQNPAILIIMLEGYTIQDTMTEIHNFITLPNWSDLEAVKSNKVFIANSINYFESEGEKAVEALEAIAEIITPRYFNYGLESTAWVKFEM